MPGFVVSGSNSCQMTSERLSDSYDTSAQVGPRGNIYINAFALYDTELLADSLPGWAYAVHLCPEAKGLGHNVSLNEAWIEPRCGR